MTSKDEPVVRLTPTLSSDPVRREIDTLLNREEQIEQCQVASLHLAPKLLERRRVSEPRHSAMFWRARKLRPALVVQADTFNPTHASLTLCPITSDCVDAPLFRVSLPAGVRTGLATSSQVMVDKIVSVPREAIGRSIGRLESSEIEIVDAALRRWLSL